MNAKIEPYQSRSSEKLSHSRRYGISGSSRQLELELRRVTDTVAYREVSSFLLTVIGEREKALRQTTSQPLSEGPQAMDAKLANICGFVTRRLSNIQSLLTKNLPFAGVGLAKHVNEVHMYPVNIGAERFYVAEDE